MVSGIALWTVGGLFSTVPAGVRLTGVIGFCILAMLRDLRVLEFALPEARRQIPRHMLRGNPLGAFRFGVEMGTGMRTYVPATAPYCLAVFLLLANSRSWLPLALASGFAVGRALTPLARYFAPDGGAFDSYVARTERTFVPVLGVVVATGTMFLSLAT